MANSSAYASALAAIATDGIDTRVEVNQRALIDKILARYSSSGAVYRELLQNSNDAEATVAEIYISTHNINHHDANTTNSSVLSSGGGGESSSDLVVTQVIYRNNGLPFRPQDWSRLRAIAEGNPDVNKVGAFGVGAYTMFSICEEPLVISGGKLGVPKEAMAFYWKGDSLWTKSGSAPTAAATTATAKTNANKNDDDDDDNNWTSFFLPSRDPYPLPDFVEFGQFLAASLTFTTCLKNIHVYVNDILILNISKTIIDSHIIEKPKSTSWWKNDGALTSSTSGMFTFGNGSELLQTTIRMDVSLRKSGLSKNDCPMDKSAIRARYASAQVKTCIPSSIEKRMVRVTKKKPPKDLTVQILMNATNDDDDYYDGEEEEVLEKDVNNSRLAARSKRKMIGRQKFLLKPPSSSAAGRAALITSSFAPSPGSGRIFIGFRTSQTTGLGIHLAAPFLPTVEREAIDFVDAALKEYNLELLEICGMLMRLALEHAMCRIGAQWEEGREERERWAMEASAIIDREKEVEDELSTKENGDNKEEKSISSSLLSFASFMARGVKNTVSEAIKPVQSIFGDDDETTELLNPSDLRPLSAEERDAILLMKSYCPRPSTPDSVVGQYLAKGFSRCLSSFSPTVLTVGGVMRGSEAKLPNLGMEAFGFSNVIRRIMLENATEYHSFIANVPTLTLDDLVLSLKSQILEEKQIIRLLKWWPKVCRIHRSMERSGLRLKEVIRFEFAPKDPLNNVGVVGASSVNKTNDAPVIHVHRLESILYFTPAKLLDLPLPETTFPPVLQKEIGLRTLENNVYQEWFAPLPFDIWTSFISQHSCLVEGKPINITLAVLEVLGKHFDSLEGSQAKRRFVELIPTNYPCIPYDCNDNEPASSINLTAVPKELYLPSSDLSAVAGVGMFHKVSGQLKVSDNFLTAIGVRTAISIDFLFLHLDALSWNTNPKPLIKYLHDADLSHADLTKLRSTKYLPAENDMTHVYAPSELYFKDKDLEIFPFVRFLQWPATEGMAKAHRDFLLKLGVLADPPLDSVMCFMEAECTKEGSVCNENIYQAALTYLTQRLGPNGLYEKDFARYRSAKFLPCIRQNLENGDIIMEMQSPSGCYYNPSALIMGFSTLDPQLDTVYIATRTKCNKDPSCQVLIKRLIQLVDIFKAKVDHFVTQGGGNDGERKKLVDKILALFDAVFAYLATRTSDFEKRDLSELAKKPFIPCEIRGQVQFYLPSQIFFRKERVATSDDDHDIITQSLFKQIKFNPFLSLVGVKAEPSLQEIFDLMIAKPDEVLDSLGEELYKAVLRRVASDPPFKQITASIRSSPFLLGYLVIDEDVTTEEEGKGHVQKAQYVLARANEIFIVDNSFLRRQFPMLVSPMEQTLEELYNRIGSKYVSEVVKKDFEVHGGTYRDTALTKSIASRLRERRPLLLSPTNSSRPMVQNAAKMLDENYLEILQADKIHAKYTFERSSKHLTVTCCCKPRTSQKMTLFVTPGPDFFDIGSAIGALILQRCQLEDALLFSQLLESPLETLRYRGFPVDRILRPVSKPPPKAPPTITENSSLNPPQGSVTRDTPLGANESVSKPSGNGEEGFESILKQMFPTCSSDVIRGLLGPNPTREKARDVADMLANALPPLCDDTKGKLDSGHKCMSEDKSVVDKDKSVVDNNINTNGKKDKASKNKLGIMGKMLRGRHHHGVGSDGKRVLHDQNESCFNSAESSTASSPEQDISTQKSLESMLSSAVQSSRSVDHAGVRSAETLLNHLPHGLERGSKGCEVIPSQNIQAFKGPHGNYKSRSGIKVFYSVDAGPEFLIQNFTAVEQFAVVIQHLADVFKLNLATVAIYYEPKGSTIAFNSNKALYFNLRFFCALHQQNVNIACYSYWFMTFAHELAHNLVTAHNKEHGSFTESIAAMYLPGFIDLLSRIT